MKRKPYIIYIILFSLYILLITAAFIGLERYSSVSSVPDLSPAIIIDAGHGGEDGGAVSNGIIEKDINLKIAKKLRNILNISGYKVTMTRDSDKMINKFGKTLRERKVSDMKERLSIFNSDNNNVVVSIHQNKFSIERYNGAQVFYGTKSKNSKALAQSIKDSIHTLLQPDNKREIKQADSNIYLLYNSNVCSVIVECGFISNINEAINLNRNDCQNKIAFAIYNGILDYYNNIRG